MTKRYVQIGLIFFLSLFAQSHITHSHPDSLAHQGIGSHPPTASHLVFEYQDKTWQIDLSRFGFDGIDPTTVNRSALQRQLDQIIAEVEQKPQNAYFENRRLVPHVTGVRVDRHKLAFWIDHLVWMQNRVLPLPVVEVHPQITNDTLTHIKEKVIGRYTTRFNPGNTPRVNNIALSSQAIDHVVVPVQGVFSFNEIVGIRTRERGYMPAPIIVKGEYSEGIGGGICQTSSTLFNSVDEAGLTVLERYVHSKDVTYVPPERDATVSWGGPDFKFKNDTNRPVLIESTVTNDTITITIYSQSDVQNQPNDIPHPPQMKPNHPHDPMSTIHP